MESKEFLTSVLGGTGTYCLFYMQNERPAQRFFDDLESLLNDAYTLDAGGADTYFALASFTESGSRSAANARSLRSFFLDLDCGDAKAATGKGYATQADALSALRGFCKETKLPRPTIVDSGRGIHVYWPVDADIARDEWRPVAERFKALCVKHNLIIDLAVPADAARVLRIPGTHNHKDTVPKPVRMVGSPGAVTTFDTFKALLGGDETDSFILTKKHYTPPARDSVMEALIGSYISKFKTILIKSADGKGCPQILQIAGAQEQISEPMWRAGLSIAKHCIDGQEAIHRISEQHPEYTPEETEHKASLIKGPYLCETFDQYNPGICPTCPNWGKIKSPIVLGREVQEASESDNIVFDTSADVPSTAPVKYVIPKYPHPYFRGKSGGIFKTVKDEDGDQKDVPVYFNDLYVTRRLKDPDAGESIVMRLHLPKDGVREFTLPLTAVGAKDEFRKHLASQGVAVLNVTELMDYTMKWVTQLQYETEASEARRQFGWTDSEGTSFVIGNMEVFKDRIEVNAPSSATRQLFPIFQPKGTLEKWIEVMEFYNRPGFELHQVMFGLSFGSILMNFQPINGAAFHVYSKDSGFGKTTAMYAGASIWGDPDTFILQERDTYNSKMNRAEVYKNLVVYLDEMTNTKPQDLSDWAYQIPSGQQRNRMGGSSNTERTRGAPWKTLFGSTGNTSMIDRIGSYKAWPKAEAQRVLECRVSKFDFSSKEETDKFSAQIKENYGHAGIVFLQYVMNNKDSVLQLIDAVQRKIDTAADLKAENRFWSVTASRTVAGLMIAKQIGLLNWDVGAVARWLIGLMASAKAKVADMGDDVEAVLTEYLADNYANILRIKSTDDARKQIGVDSLIAPDAIPRMKFVARYEYDIKRMYLLPKPFKHWCTLQQLPYSAIFESLCNGPTKARKEKVRLSRGTRMSMPPVDVIVIDCSGFLDDETEDTMAVKAAMRQKSAQE